MKIHIKNLFLLPALIVGLGLILTGRVTAQTFTTLHNFTNEDGAYPQAGLILSGKTLYGVTDAGGDFGSGTVFAVNTNGSGFTNLYIFTGGSDGAYSQAGLLLSGNTLYGVTGSGGISGSGTVFAVNTNGSGFTNLYSFTWGSDGAYPYDKLILSGNTLYGTALEGGNFRAGMVFAVSTNGSGFTNLYSFTGGSDGAYPYAGLILSGNTLYGVTGSGGDFGSGTVFAVSTNGSGFTNLYIFTATDANGFNNDGAYPEAGLILSGNTLYGTAIDGGTNGDGTVFSLTLPMLQVATILSAPQVTGGNTNFTFLLSGPSGSNYVLQVSTNLLNWSSVSTSTIPVSGSVNLSNAISGYNRRFYRVYLQ